MVVGSADREAVLGRQPPCRMHSRVEDLADPDGLAVLVEHFEVGVRLAVCRNADEVGDCDTGPVRQTNAGIARQAIARGSRLKVLRSVVSVEVEQRVAEADGLW